MLLQGFCWCFIYFIREVWLFTLHSSLFCAPDDPQQFGVLGVFFSLLFTHIWQFYFWAGVKKTELCFKDRSWFFFTIPALVCIQNSAYFYTFYSNRSGCGNARKNGAELTRIPTTDVSAANGKEPEEASSFFDKPAVRLIEHTNLERKL